MAKVTLVPVLDTTGQEIADALADIVDALSDMNPDLEPMSDAEIDAITNASSPS